MAMDYEYYPPETKARNRGFLGPTSDALPLRDRQDREQLRFELDLNSWNLRIWGVAASGFLTDSYNLFASNAISGTLAFVYFPHNQYFSLIINLLTLAGSVCGQLLFGFLADRYGRTRLYGIELVLVLVSTIGVATANTGYNNNMSFLALFTFWRFVMGIGIGAEYPLSAVVTAEWSSTKARATMLSSVFLMQPIGQALAQVVSLLVLVGQDRQHGLQDKRCGLDSLHDDDCKKVVDGIWRMVIGSGAVPALLAICFRFFLYDCGLYTLEVKSKPGNAFRDTQRVYGPPAAANQFALAPGSQSPYPAPPMPVQFSLQDLRNYFVRDGNWHYLLGTAMAWFFLDMSFFGFSLDNGATIADLWSSTPPAPLGPELWCWKSTGLLNGTSLVPRWADSGLPVWQTDTTRPCNTIYETLLAQSKQYLLTVSIASIAGSCCFIMIANRVSRRKWLVGSFITLTVMFIATGCVYFGVAHTPAAPANIVLVAICYFLFNLGANTVTFIIPAEIFPTCYRCTCHGISAAAGKMGSIVASLLFYAIRRSYKSSERQGLVFLLFASFMVFGAIYAWAYLPDVQQVEYDQLMDSPRRRLVNLNLETLGEGRERARREGKIHTIRDKIAALRWRKRGGGRLGSSAGG